MRLSSKTLFLRPCFAFSKLYRVSGQILSNETFADCRVRISLSREKLTVKSVSYCDNETVDGVEFPSFPNSLDIQSGEDERLVVADMSSNFLSRQVPISKYAVIFGGTHKSLLI